MPGNGTFTLSVVDATTLDTLKEYDDGSTTWIKGEDGDEFFIVIKSETYDHVRCCIQVDGKDLGYTWKSKAPNESTPLGPLKEGQVMTSGKAGLVTHAYRFVRHAVAETSSSDEDAPHPGCGTITATWHSVECTDTSAICTKTNAWVKDDLPIGGGSHKKDSSVLRSTVGSMPGSLPTVCPGTYEDVEELCTLSIKYTTDFGLAVRGLLKDEDVGHAIVKEKCRKRRRGMNVAQEVKEEKVETSEEVEYTVTYNDDGKELITLEE